MTYGASPARSVRMVWLGSPKLPGTWNANQPPGATFATSEGSRSRWPGTHWSVALETSTSTRIEPVETQSRRSATSNSRPGTSRRAVSIISGLESRPVTVASGQRAASRAVRLPGPQPRSTTLVGDSASIREIRSTNGRPRSSA